jgi:hypothetical protein
MRALKDETAALAGNGRAFEEVDATAEAEV